MTIFRWIMGVLAGLTATGAVLSFVLFMMVDINVWIERARGFRQVCYTLCLFWFNVEVWGKVVWTLVHWTR